MTLETIETYQLVMNGLSVNAFHHFIVRNPATGRAIAHAPEVTRSQVDYAVHSANHALAGWAATATGDRARLFLQAARLLEENECSLAELLTSEQGKPMADSIEEVRAAVECFNRAATVEVTPKVLSESASHVIQVRYLPVGVVAAILPWNFPLFLAADKIARSLAFGNTVVVKPSPFTPLTSLRIGALLCELFPPGVVNVITGTDLSEIENPGHWLVCHSAVRKICFVGGTLTGKHLLACSVHEMKRTSLEMGGNDPAIVLEDAIIADAAKGILSAALANNGQICVAVKRVYVARTIFDQFVEAFVNLAKKRSLEVGDGAQPGVSLGPVNNRKQWAKLQDFLEEAVVQGGRVLCGGGPPEHIKSGGDLFLAPTVVVGMSETCRLVAEEQFGPIIPIIPYDMVSEAVHKANSTIYGLGASVWGVDVTQANSVATALQAGMVWVNEHGANLGKAPCGGFKQSGLGREGDWAEADTCAFTETQVIKLAK